MSAGFVLPGNMLGGYRLVLTFANGVLTQFNKPSHLRSHVVGPLDAGFIVIVNKGRLINIKIGKPELATL
jgi:hypothetical protein